MDVLLWIRNVLHLVIVFHILEHQMLNVKNFHKDAIIIQQRKYVQMKMFVVNIVLKINKLNVNLFYKLMEIHYVYMIQLIKYVERKYVQIT
jgi:hypothetical protein